MGDAVSNTAIFPALDVATESALRASIERFGVLTPVLYDQHGELVDGANRVRLAAELGVSCPSTDVELPDDSKERGAALTALNDARRQRMEVGQRREVVAALRSDGHSMRAIAGAVGVSQSMVHKDIVQLSTSEQLTEPERSIGLDGKSRPTRKKPEAYYGKGDKFDDVVVPLRRYLRSWEKRDYQFEHVPPRQAARRLRLLSELRTGIDAAIEDLGHRSEIARVRITKGSH
jgi:transposase-like protein